MQRAEPKVGRLRETSYSTHPHEMEEHQPLPDRDRWMEVGQEP